MMGDIITRDEASSGSLFITLTDSTTKINKSTQEPSCNQFVLNMKSPPTKKKKPKTAKRHVLCGKGSPLDVMTTPVAHLVKGENKYEVQN
jgi:hypothetical protein